ncbi:MAG: hypothetical protein JNK45_22870, partial [Myxococcales bacterium]|nr:hypothetical protein [Myxococcales bacterium]
MTHRMPCVPEPPSTPAMLAAVTDAMGSMHRNQVHRDRWPDFAAFASADYD